MRGHVLLLLQVQLLDVFAEGIPRAVLNHLIDQQRVEMTPLVYRSEEASKLAWARKLQARGPAQRCTLEKPCLAPPEIERTAG